MWGKYDSRCNKQRLVQPAAEGKESDACSLRREE
jgi:hypothetical protein